MELSKEYIRGPVVGLMVHLGRAQGPIALHETGRESDVDNDRLRPLVESDPRRATRELAQDLGVHCAAIAKHLHQLGEVHQLAQWLRHDLTERDRQRRAEVATQLLD
ncbi:unnamed protein product [Heligmosomoides polygyrus]|uniref:Transcriptional regulator n=1 Tax=Heligmosomoides polygyrus TaxID=6339 RepID=A0A183FA02_HELPZ|nr:unnamed protein product [Heligmosomoides polygyrus]